MNKIRKGNIFHRRLDFNYPLITRGKGIYLYDETGKKYIDACGGALVANLGHGLGEISREIGKLAAKITYLHGAQFSTRAMEDYAKELCQVAPKELDRVFFVSGGSEGVETALKLAKQYNYDLGYKEKYKIIHRTPCYHGSSCLTLSLSTKEGFKKAQRPLLFDFPAIPAPFCYRCPLGKSYPACGIQCAKALETVIKKEGPENVSAFIAEPVIGSAVGAAVPPKEYFPLIRKICDKYHILLVLDEVMAGFGRTGKWFACQHWDFVPDIIVVSKGISAGFVPLTAVFCRRKILEAIKKGSGGFNHGFTFENNPFTTGVGLAVLRYIKKRGLINRGARMGRYLMSQLKKLKDIDIVGDVRGIGLMVAVEFVENKKTKQPFPKEKQAAIKIVQAAMKKGLNLYFSTGFVSGAGDAVMLAPPFNVTKKEIDKIIKLFKEAILEVKSTL